ncbi:aminodeoxychorismate lyase [Alkalicoccobacillus porphyridii]|uniref:Aminodeoxychorismate lyase n=1 Tax=Alkalicoccobacillus porphyridii TaxID=2597270 RepID=A0A553ZU81_9BACI|nr:aminodeoxychorismate lyase [Alkalicoccobacillus porphyridii]TSB45024.1 aminodeoxychorismate lyase [Alkalicoccobacillus porphyridii]
MYIYLNGEFVEQTNAKIPIMDHGYLYGLGLFETFRIYNGHPFLLDDHFQRMEEGLKEVGIKWSISRKEALRILQRLLELNQLEDAYVRWNVSAGSEQLGLYTGYYEQPTVSVFMKPLPKQIKDKSIVILNQRRNTPEGTKRLKSHHYLNNALAKREIGDAPHKEGIFLTEAGWVAEGIVSNVFWVKSNKVYTPAVETGILDGVTRRYVLAHLKKTGIPVEEGYFTQEALLQADEAFLTNSIQESVRVESCMEQSYARESTIITELKEAFKRDTNRRWSIAEVGV